MEGANVSLALAFIIIIFFKSQATIYDLFHLFWDPFTNDWLLAKITE